MKVGFIGLGTMGASMATNLQRGGYDLGVNDIRPDAGAAHLAAGAEWADTARDVATKVDVLFTSLRGPPEVEEVALGTAGLLEGLLPGTAYFDLSTNSPTLIRRLQSIFAERGIHLLDAPVSGGPAGAKSGKLAIWVGGDPRIFQRHKPVLDAIGDQVIHVGPIGSGSVAKLGHNFAGYMLQCAPAQAVSMC